MPALLCSDGPWRVACMLVFFSYWCCRKKGGGNAWTTIKDCIGPICRECYRDPAMSFEGRVEEPRVWAS